MAVAIRLAGADDAAIALAIDPTAATSAQSAAKTAKARRIGHLRRCAMP